MTAGSFADLVRARKTGAGKWQAKCPAHPDHSPSLSIREGREGRVLLQCFAGCSHTSIARVLGLKISDLFSTKPLSPEQLAQVTAQREAEKRQHEAKRRSERLLEDHVRRLEAVQDSLGAKLARLGEGNEGDAMSLLLHQACDLHRSATTELEELYATRKAGLIGPTENNQHA